MDILVYIRSVCWAAIRGSGSVAAGIVSWGSAIIGAVAFVIPNIGMTLDASALQAAIGTLKFWAVLLAAVIVVRLICAQYWVWRDEKEARVKEKKRADEAYARLDEKQCALSIGSLTHTCDPYGITCWIIRIVNDGPAPAEDVQIVLVKIEPRPRDDRWLDHYPQKVRLLDHGLAAPTIAVRRSEDFAPIIEIGRTDTGMAVISNITKNDIMLFSDESWTLHYEFFAKNSKDKDAKKFCLRLVNSPKRCLVELLS